MNQKNLYDFRYFSHSDGIQAWKQKSLKFGDAMAALCYAYGISWDQLTNRFADCFEVEQYGRAVYRKDRVIDDQIDFLKNNQSRQPTKVLEIGGGRGEVANTLKYMGVDCVSVEIGKDAKRWYSATGEQYFGHMFNAAEPVVDDVNNYILSNSLREFDTIIMVESLEHIPEDQFNKTWNKIKAEFLGRFIVVNWMDYHPCEIGSFGASPEEHCRLVDDDLYDQWISESKKCIFRKGSHLVFRILIVLHFLKI